ncbi:hypothetical protein BDA99DRAFT_169657 [Phascolomyces articulosus]|uniref:GATA-type domain-containing protein n=1 Tax=Phascolomyces articulosus TaxID=60185 RepID=A0AAD5JTQ1_9FUNG|nr:hypothetical protein BDA99DRAFT_169657 [Phascolomyces articulosus]
MLQTLGDAREQWLEQQQQELQQQPLKISTTTLNNNKNMSRYSSTSPKSKSTQQRTTTTTINHPSSPSPPAPTSKTISQQQSKRSREQSIDIPKQCHSCQSAETPEWRKGPMGPRTLCNACGLIWAKLARQQGIPEGPDEEPSTTNVDDNHEANKYALSYLLS